MASLVLTDAFVSIDGNDISAYVTSVTLEYSADMPEDTTMGDDTHLMIGGGLKNWSLSVECNNDYTAAALDSILFPLVGTSFAIILRPDSAVVGVNNPQFTGTGVLESYTPVGGAVGELATTSVTINAGGTLARATA